MPKTPLLLALLVQACIHGDGILAAAGSVVTPDNRPAGPCVIAITTSREPPIKQWSWRPFQGQFREGTLSHYKRSNIHIRCDGWSPVVRTALYSRDKGWSTDSTRFFPVSEPLDLGTIVLRPLP